MFEKNLSKLTNKRLRDELLNIPISDCTDDISFVTTLNGDIVFLKGEIPVEDTIDPIGYIKSLITDKMKSFATNDIIISIGFGVGYILDELYNSTKSKIVIYEPDSKFLRFIFESIDLTQYLSDKRVFISDNKNECIDFILKNYLNNDKIEFVVSKILTLFYKDDFEKFTTQLYDMLQGKIIDINTIKKLSKKWVKNIINFINLKKKFYSLEDFKWKFVGKNALILGAGPSLRDNIENIKANRDKFVIFAVNKSLKILEESGIIPDFAVFADADFIKRFYDLSPEFTSNLNIIADWKTESYVAELKSKSLMIYFSNNEYFLKKYSRELDIQMFPSEPTTTIIALMCANYMDFEKICFCGLDLVFKGDKAYYKDESIDFSGENAVIDNEQRKLIEVLSITGEKVKTREDYSMFIKNLESIIKTKGLKNLYNITNFGAFIEGMNYSSFESLNVYGNKPNLDLEFRNIDYCNKDLKKYLDKEKTVLLEINRLIINKSPISLITKKIINESALLYEYLQLELVDLSRGFNEVEVIDSFYSKTILAIDKLLAIMN